MATQETGLVPSNSDVLSIAADLRAKRDELAAELDGARAVFDRIQGEIRAVDTVLRLFGAGAPLHKTEIPLHRQEISKIVLFALRTSSAPLTSLDLARILLAEKRMSPHDKKLVKDVSPRIRGTLRHFRKQGVLTATENADGLLAWRYVNPPKSRTSKADGSCSR